jgi:dTMP kinase
MLIERNFFNFTAPRGFIVVDGVNGAGKGTLLSKIVPFLEARGKKVVLTREPGGTTLGVHLRAMLLEERAGKPAPLTEALLFAADRAEHVATKIRPALESGSVVLTDRYYYSSLAFQGYGRGLDLQKIRDVNLVAIDGMLPDVVLLLDLNPEEGLRRTRRRTQASSGHTEKDTFEQEELSFHERLRNGFLTMAREFPEPFLKVDATQTPDEIFQFVLPVLNALLSKLPA